MIDKPRERRVKIVYSGPGMNRSVEVKILNALYIKCISSNVHPVVPIVEVGLRRTGTE